MGARKIFSEFADLLDRATVNLPVINGPLMSALSAITGRLDVIEAGGGGTLPIGGTTGQTIVKSSGADFDATWATPPGGGDALTSGNLSQFAATTSAQLAGVMSDETGTGLLVFNNAPTFIAPVLGTPASGDLANCTFPTLNQSTTGNAATASSAPAGALTGTTLAAGVVSSSLTSVGIIATGTWQGDVIAPAYLGTGTAISTKFLRGDGTWQAITGGGDALTSGNLSQFAATTSAQLAGVMADETGTGLLVFNNAPTFIAPVLGTPASGTLTSCTGLPLSTGTTGTLSVSRGGTGVATSGTTSQIAVGGGVSSPIVWTTATGTGAPVRANSPTLASPILGTPLSGTLTSCTGLPIIAGTTGTLSIARGGTGATTAAAARTALGVVNTTGIAVSDESTELTASTTVPLATFHTQKAGSWAEVLIGLTTAHEGGPFTGDVHLNGVSIFSTRPTIETLEDHSSDAVAAAVMLTTPTVFAVGDKIELFADTVGTVTGGKGLKFYFNE